MESERTEGRIDTSLAVHRALVETYALKEAGLPLVMDYYSISTEDYAKHVAEGARFEHDANGQMALVLESEELRQSILECVTPHDRSSDDRAIKDAEIDEEQWEKEEEEEEVVVDEDEKERLAEGEMKSGEAEEKPSQTINEDDEIDSEPEAPELPLSDEGFFDPTRSSFPAAFMPASDTWRDVSLEDSAIKFAVGGP